MSTTRFALVQKKLESSLMALENTVAKGETGYCKRFLQSQNFLLKTLSRRVFSPFPPYILILKMALQISGRKFYKNTYTPKAF